MVYHLLKPTDIEILDGEDESDDELLDSKIEDLLKKINLTSGKVEQNNDHNYMHLEALLAEQSELRQNNENMVKDQNIKQISLLQKSTGADLSKDTVI